MSGITANNKVYDGNTKASINTRGMTLVGAFGADDVTLNVDDAAGAFADKNVGTGKVVTVSGLTLTGSDAHKYSLTQPTTTADITPRTITIAAVADTKTYDGTASSALVPVITSGALAAGDTAIWTQSFVDGQADTSKTLAPAGKINDGYGGKNYYLNLVKSTAGVILPRELRVAGISAQDKVFDGSNEARVDLSTAVLVGVIGSDRVELNVVSVSGAFSDGNIGSGKTINISGLTFDGADAANYVLVQPSLTADIRPVTAPIMRVEGNYCEIPSRAAKPEAANNTEFGRIALGSILVKTFNIKNSGNAPLSLSGSPVVNLVGAHAADFTVMPPAASQVPAAGGTTFNIRFEPSTAGPHAATVCILNDSSVNPYTFTIQGTGIEVPRITSAPPTSPWDQGLVYPPFAISATPGAGALVFSATGLPPGLTMDPGTGIIAGTPADVGSFSPTIVATDAAGNSGIVTTTVIINPSPNIKTASPLPSWDRNTAGYVQALVATLGTGPWPARPWSITGGALPNGLALNNATGIVSGTPVAAGSYAFSVRVSDAIDGHSDKLFGMVVNPLPAIRIEGNSNAIISGKTTTSAIDNTDFGHTPVAGVTVNKTFSILNTGEANLNLALAAICIEGSDAADFTVTTKPAAAVAAGGRTTFTIGFNPSATGLRSATASITSDDRTNTPYTFAIEGRGDPSSITVISPGGGKHWNRGSTQTISWVATDVPGSVDIDLLKGGNQICQIASSVDAALGSLAWTVPEDQAVATEYQVQIASTSNPGVNSTSDSFSVSVPPLIVVTPAGNEVWQANSHYTIAWATTGLAGELRIELIKNGVVVSNIASRTAAGTGHYYWHMPASTATGGDYRIKISSATNHSISAISAGFYIKGRQTPEVNLTAPAAGEVWLANSRYAITWTSTSLLGSLRIELLKHDVPVSILTPRTSLSSGRYLWLIPAATVASDAYRIRLTNPADTSMTDVSGCFTIKS